MVTVANVVAKNLAYPGHERVIHHFGASKARPQSTL